MNIDINFDNIDILTNSIISKIRYNIEIYFFSNFDNYVFKKITENNFSNSIISIFEYEYSNPAINIRM